MCISILSEVSIGCFCRHRPENQPRRDEYFHNLQVLGERGGGCSKSVYKLVWHHRPAPPRNEVSAGNEAQNKLNMHFKRRAQVAVLKRCLMGNAIE